MVQIVHVPPPDVDDDKDDHGPNDSDDLRQIKQQHDLYIYIYSRENYVLALVQYFNCDFAPVFFQLCVFALVILNRTIRLPLLWMSVLCPVNR